VAGVGNLLFPAVGLVGGEGDIVKTRLPPNDSKGGGVENGFDVAARPGRPGREEAEGEGVGFSPVFLGCWSYGAVG